MALFDLKSTTLIQICFKIVFGFANSFFNYIVCSYIFKFMTSLCITQQNCFLNIFLLITVKPP